MLTALISVTVVVSLSTVGLLLSVAMIVIPGATARLVTNTVETMTGLAVLVGVSSALGGLTASYHLATPPGATIAVGTVIWFTGAAAAERAMRGRPVAPRSGVQPRDTQR